MGLDAYKSREWRGQLATDPRAYTGTMAVLLEANSLTKRYGTTIALDDVDSQVADGITGLLGPNGARKSTAIKRSLGLIRPTAGSAEVMGRRPYDSPEVRERLGYMPEHDCLPPGTTAAEFLSHMVQVSGLPPRSSPDTRGRHPAARRSGRRALPAYRTVLHRHEAAGEAGPGFGPRPRSGPAGRAHRRPRPLWAGRHAGAGADAQDRRLGTYSRGMRQRMRLAAALVHDPEVLVLDEPLSGTDPRQRLQFHAAMVRLAQEGRTVLVSSHILEEVELLADRIVLMVSGKLAAAGDIRAIREKLDEQAYKVRIVTDDPRGLAAALVRLEEVDSVNLGADSDLIVPSRNVAVLQESIPRMARELGARLFRIEPLDESLESIFGYVVDR